MRHFYSVALYLALPLILTRLYWRGRKAPAYRRRWAERFGFIPALPWPGCLWLHAVSVGETRAALPLIQALRRRYPDLPLLITTTTPTGSQQVRDALGNTVHHVYAPYDFPDAVARFLDRTRPRLVIVMETELWPNLFYQCGKRAIPVLVANARLSERSAKGYAKLRGLTVQTLKQALIIAQSQAIATRFRALGATRVRVTGNIKYDLVLPDDLIEQGRGLRRMLGEQRPVLIAASTRDGEDELILDAFESLRQTQPKLLLLLAPRHPERFATVAALCRQRGLSVVRHSQGEPCKPAAQVFLGDAMGALLLFYAAADVAFVGGSLVPVGGHNVLEPALLGVPVVFGPHMFNFAEASQYLLQVEAAWQVADVEALTKIVGRLLVDKKLRQEAGRRGKAVIERNRGALAALLEIIDEVMKGVGEPSLRE